MIAQSFGVGTERTAVCAGRRGNPVNKSRGKMRQAYLRVRLINNLTYNKSMCFVKKEKNGIFVQ
jgi:hypothetical protein